MSSGFQRKTALKLLKKKLASTARQHQREHAGYGTIFSMS